MKSTIFTSLCVAALSLPSVATAQSTIEFEANDYRAIGVYDTWEHSPFRSQNGAAPVLQGNVQVTDNIDTNYDEVLKGTPNASQRVLGIQRSRYGSNTFGARIDLLETFELTPETKYVHVLIHKPQPGRVMLIGLGKRKDRPGQSKETEQFWVFSKNTVTENKWVDAVFPIKGAGGIDIHSLVVVPDCEDRSGMNQDFLAYIDRIELNEQPLSSTNRDSYPLNFSKTQKYTRTDRGLKGIRLGNQRMDVYSSITNQTPTYTYLTKSQFTAKPGDNLRPAFNYLGYWMNGYVYIDYDNNGRFDVAVENGKIIPNTPNDLSSYSFLAASEDNENFGFNSAGDLINDDARNTLSMPTFKLPDDLPYGFYRMRYKVDWNNSDPGGNFSSSNDIVHNGGAVIDIRLNVHSDSVTVSTGGGLNGNVVAEDGKELNKAKAAFGEPFTVKIIPAQGFNYSGMKVRHGYNLGRDSLLHDTYQFVDEYIPRDKFDEKGCYTLPAEMMDGDVSLEGVFIDEKYTLIYEVYFDNKKVDSITFIGAQPGPVSMPDGKKREYCEYTCEVQNVTTLPAVVRVDAKWIGPMKLTNSADTTWYVLKVQSQDKWVTYDASAQPNVLFSSSSEVNDSKRWAFCGNPYEGIMLKNRVAGDKFVLASPSPKNDGNAGGNTYAVMKATDNIQSNETANWTLSKSSYDDNGLFICNPEGYGLNFRNNTNLAYWTGGKDGGSTFVPFSPLSTGIFRIKEAGLTDKTFDLSGKRVGEHHRGLIIRNGKKMMVE